MRQLWILVVVGGCTPLIPFHLAETAEVLKQGSVSLTVAGGGGGGRDVDKCCGGGSARVSVGVGRSSEVGFEASVVGGAPDTHNVNLLTKFRYKLGFHKNLALLAGLGVIGAFDTQLSKNDRAGLGADVGVVASSDPIAGFLRVYGGARFSFVFGLEKDLYDGVPTQAFVVPAGLSFQANPAWRFFLEGGLVGGWSEFRFENKISRGDWIGGYGLFAISHTWGI